MLLYSGTIYISRKIGFLVVWQHLQVSQPRCVLWGAFEELPLEGLFAVLVDLVRLAAPPTLIKPVFSQWSVLSVAL